MNLFEVRLGIVEANGKLSVLKRDSKAYVTLEDMNLTKKSTSLSYPVIVDGEIYGKVLIKLELSNDWLLTQLRDLNIKTVEDVFFASINTKKELHISLKNYMADKQNIIPLSN